MYICTVLERSKNLFGARAFFNEPKGGRFEPIASFSHILQPLGWKPELYNELYPRESLSVRLGTSIYARNPGCM